jgi:uncharacterized protein with NAD-binding domain and iron-sulfur cluster
MADSEPAKVAIVGGGCASIAAAFELTRPQHRGRYEVTVYQLGWRLGGKGASGRGPGGRIEEHGLHIWLGFYENAFRLMRECYDELDRDPLKHRISSWQDAFFSDPYVGMADVGSDGRWLQWTALFPDAGGLPGDPLTKTNPFTVSGYLSRALALLRTLVFDVRTRRAKDGDGAAEINEECASDVGRQDPDQISKILEQLSRYGRLGTATGLIEAFAVLETVMRIVVGANENSFLVLLKKNSVAQAVIELLRNIATAARETLEESMAKDDESRYAWEIIDLVVAIMTGIIREGLLFDSRGFDAINDKECREWLLENGASRRSVDSAFVRGLFDLAMAYPGGDAKRPALAAGQAIRGSLRMFFTYRGSLFWKMRAGMGDIVFAPFYEVLKRRGVRFEFFHRLENVGLSSSGNYVETLQFDVQAETRSDDEYQPLIDIKGLPCWPSSPDYSQLKDGKKIERNGWQFESFWDRNKVAEKTLRVTEDFDFVVLGVGIGAIPFLCKEILERDQRWRDMVAKVTSVPSQAFQVWMRDDMPSLGWTAPAATISAFAKPFDTWADMRHLIEEEDLPEPPASIAYFCGVLPVDESPVDRDDPEYPLTMQARVRQNALDFLNTHVAGLWPGAVDAEGNFRWELLVDANGGPPGVNESTFDSQFWTANINPSDRYTLAPPGSMQYRISPLDNTYDNLTITGDWTDCGFNEGCVEAAIMSGRLAAHALSGIPALDQIIGYDHP